MSRSLSAGTLISVGRSWGNRTQMIPFGLETVKKSQGLREKQGTRYIRPGLYSTEIALHPNPAVYLRGRRRGRRPRDRYYLSVTVTKAERGEQPSRTNSTEYNDRRIGVALPSRSISRLSLWGESISARVVNKTRDESLRVVGGLIRQAAKLDSAERVKMYLTFVQRYDVRNVASFTSETFNNRLAF